MHIAKVITTDCANGEGIRVSVFVSGCKNRCKGCFQPETWNFDYGKEYTKKTENDIINELSKPYYSGITILGGEPFELENQKTVLQLLKRVKKELPDKNIWVYTGYFYDRDLAPGGKRYGKYTEELLELIDILVDGPFVRELKNISLAFRGSENQRIINLRKKKPI